MDQQPDAPQKPGHRFDRPLRDVAATEGERCASDPNIVSVGFGLKIVGGKPQFRAALQYHVLSKLDDDEAIRQAQSEPVPQTVEGYETDVLPWVANRPAACPGSKSPTGDRGGDKEDPLLGGTSTTVLGDFHSFPTGYGTLGGICFDAANGDAMALSNAHVYGSETGNDVIQPWLPSSEYLEAALKYLTCGPILSHLLFWTAPSPLTVLLTGAAAGAWTAAILSDAEDPSRWGQRVGAAPPASDRTEREVVRLKVPDVPDMPFPGRVWKAKTEWDYERVTTSGTTSESTSDERLNEHVLVGKRVITNLDTYYPGDRVTICANLLTPASNKTLDRFVVAHCFPIAEPERIIKRVLVPDNGACTRIAYQYEENYKPACVNGFASQIPGISQIIFPLMAPPFIILSSASITQLLPTTDPNNPSGVDVLQIPARDALKVVCPPSTHVTLDVFHLGEVLTAKAFSANGTLADHTTTSKTLGTVETLELSGPEIVRVELSGGKGDGYLAAICADKRHWPAGAQGPGTHLPNLRSRYYTGALDLAVSEPPGKWAVVAVSQTIDATPTNGDPVQAARLLGGIVDSANVIASRECACSVLFDHVFDVVHPGVVE